MRERIVECGKGTSGAKRPETRTSRRNGRNEKQIANRKGKETNGVLCRPRRLRRITAARTNPLRLPSSFSFLARRSVFLVRGQTPSVEALDFRRSAAASSFAKTNAAVAHKKRFAINCFKRTLKKNVGVRFAPSHVYVVSRVISTVM